VRKYWREEEFTLHYSIPHSSGQTAFSGRPCDVDTAGAVQNLGADSHASRCNQVMAGPRSVLSQSGEIRFPVSFWAVGPSALPCAGGLPPQRPPDVLLPPSVGSIQPCSSCSPALPAAQRAAPKSANAAATVGAGLVPAQRAPKAPPKLVDNSSHRWHEVPAGRFPPQNRDVPDAAKALTLTLVYNAVSL